MEMEDTEEIRYYQHERIYDNHLLALQNSFIDRIRVQNKKKDEEKDEDAEADVNELIVANLCHAVWVRFAKTHQKSPSRKNNNVQSCSNKTRVRCGEEEGYDECRGVENKSFISDSRLQAKTTSLIGTLCYVLTLVLRFIKILFYTGLVFAMLYCVVVLHKPTQAVVSTNTQDLIYPLMRALRVLSVPYVKSFPILTNLYEESCLISNPYFTMTDVDCWPCETSRSIIDLTGFSNFSAAYYGSGIPFIVKDAYKSNASIDDILAVSYDNSDLLREPNMDPTFRKIAKISQMSQSSANTAAFDEENVHIQWKINRVSNARFLRRYFPKPYFIPNNTEVSVQHFLFVDQIRSPTYPLPITEFANVFVTQASGTRFIVLVPTDWCKKQCKVVSIVLQPKDVYLDSYPMPSVKKCR